MCFYVQFFRNKLDKIRQQLFMFLCLEFIDIINLFYELLYVLGVNELKEKNIWVKVQLNKLHKLVRLKVKLGWINYIKLGCIKKPKKSTTKE